MNNISSQLQLAEIKCKLLTIIMHLQEDSRYTKQDAVEGMAEILDYLSEDSPNASFLSMVYQKRRLNYENRRDARLHRAIQRNS